MTSIRANFIHSTICLFMFARRNCSINLMQIAEI